MDVYLFLKTLHILSAIVFMGGILARQVVRAVAERATDVRTFAEQSAAGRIESLMVIPGNLVVIIIGVIIALMTGQPIFGTLQGGSSNWLLVSNLIIVVLILQVPLVFIPRGRKFEPVLKEALARNEMTPELRVALHDPVVRAAHMAEIVGGVIIVYLMTAKPF